MFKLKDIELNPSRNLQVFHNTCFSISGVLIVIGEAARACAFVLEHLNPEQKRDR